MSGMELLEVYIRDSGLKKEDYYSQLPKDEQILLEAYRQDDGTYRKMMEMIIFNYIEERNKKNAESEEN